MKTYMALDGLRWSRDSGSANCDMPRSAVFGRSGGVQNSMTISNNLILIMFTYLTPSFFFYVLWFLFPDFVI